MDKQADQSANRAWIEDGIAYSEYHGELTLHAILELQAKIIDLLKDTPNAMLPGVVIMTDVHPGGFKLGFRDFAKIVTSFNLTSHIPGLWVVGASEELKRKAAPMNKLFFGGGIHYMNSLEEAVAEAKKHIAVDTPVIDKVLKIDD